MTDDEALEARAADEDHAEPLPPSWWRRGLHQAGVVARRAAIVSALAGVMVGAVGVYVYQQYVVPSLDAQLATIGNYRPPTVVKVRDAAGNELDRFQVERRFYVPLDELPPVVWQAVLAAEDRRFFEHNGVDVLGIARAMRVNWAAGAIREGASTLTQQLLKNLVVGSERTFSRKLREALLAVRLERKVGKERVLELYLNEVYFGSGNYGVEAAAQDYFGVSAREMTAAQSALLAGLVPAPSRWSPRRDPAGALARRSVVLREMMEEGYLTPDELDAAMAEPVQPPDRLAPTLELGAAYVTAVRREVRALFGPDAVSKAGLDLHVAMDPVVQAAAEAAVREAAEAVEKRQGHAGPKQFLPYADWTNWLDQAPGLQRDNGKLVEPKPGDCFPALAVPQGKFKAGPFSFYTSIRGWWRRVRSFNPTIPSDFLAKRRRIGEVWDICLDERGRADLAQASWVQGAMVVMENETGHVLAMTGGIDMPLEGFHRAVQAKRQAGSAFKPLVYAAALQAGRSQLDVVDDAPLYFGSGRSAWSPRNAGGGFWGPVTLRRALASSLNTPPVRLMYELGPDTVVDTAKRLGVSSPLRGDLTLALGSSEVTVLDIATAFSTLARGGQYRAPVLIASAVDPEGLRLLPGDRVVAGGEVVELPGALGEQVVDPSVAWQVIDMMTEAVTSGTATRAWARNKSRAGKTGTTTGFADAWFVGVTPRYTVVTWIGEDQHRSLGMGESGGRSALPAFLSVLDVLEEPDGERFTPPAGIVHLPYGERWVGVAAEYASERSLPLPKLDDGPLPDFPGVGSDCR